MEKEYSLVVSTEFWVKENRKYRLPVILFSFFWGDDLHRRKVSIMVEKRLRTR
jgi:hypothetical protein